MADSPSKSTVEDVTGTSWAPLRLFVFCAWWRCNNPLLTLGIAEDGIMLRPKTGGPAQVPMRRRRKQQVGQEVRCCRR